MYTKEKFMDKVKTRERSGFMNFIVRLIVGMVVLGITAFLTPGFVVSSFFSLFLAALTLSLLDWIVSRITGINATPFARGISGFILAAFIIYITKFIVIGYDVSFMGAIIGAAVYGVIDAIIPGRAM